MLPESAAGGIALLAAPALPTVGAEPPEVAPGHRPIGAGPSGGVYDRRAVMSGIGLGTACLVAAATLPAVAVGGVIGLLSVVLLCRRVLLSWTGLLVLMTATVLLIPVRRFKLPIPLPFALEPYRVIIIVLVVATLISLCVDPRVTWQRTGFGGHIAIFFAGMLLSIGANIGPLSDAGLLGSSVGALINYALLFSVFFLTRILLTSGRRVTLLVEVLTVGGAVIGAGAAMERVAHYNIFLKLGSLLQLQLMSEAGTILRNGGARAFGSAQHPIALGVLLGMLMPLAVYQARHSTWPSKKAPRTVFWVCCATSMGVGIICSVSRTSMVVLVVMAVIGVRARPKLFRPLIFAGVPAALLASLVAPGVVLNMVRGFLSPKALIASQYSDPGWRGSGRLADLGPNLVSAMQHPFFGTGVGSRIVTGPTANALILDDQVLNTLLETGFVGIAGLAVLIVGPVRRLRRFSLSPTTPAIHTDLAVAVRTSILGYFVSLFFFDGFGFLQTVMIFGLLLAIGARLVTSVPATVAPGRRAVRHAGVSAVAS